MHFQYASYNQLFILQDIPSNQMLSRASGAQQYYFQIKVHTLRSNISQNKKIKITIFKGIQKSDFTKQQINFVGKVLNMNETVLNFYVSSYNPKKSIQFNVKLSQTNQQKDIELGQFTISSNPYITQFIEDGSFSYQLTNQFNQQIYIDYSLYVDRSRLALINAIKKLQSDKKNIPQIPISTVPQSLISASKSGQKSQQKMQTPKIKRQLFGNSTTQQQDAQVIASQQKVESTRDLSENTRRILRRSNNNSRSYRINDLEDKKKAESVKNQQINTFSNNNIKRRITRSPQRDRSLKKSESNKEEKIISSPLLERKTEMNLTQTKKQIISKGENKQIIIDNSKEKSSNKKSSQDNIKNQNASFKPVEVIQKKYQMRKSQSSKKLLQVPQQKKQQRKKVEQNLTEPMQFSLNIKMGIMIGIGVILIYILTNVFSNDKADGKKKNKKEKKRKNE